MDQFDHRGWGIGLARAWLPVVALANAARSSGRSLSETKRILPGTVRLAAALCSDQALPRPCDGDSGLPLISTIQPGRPDFPTRFL